MRVRQPYRLRDGQHRIEREIAPLIEREFPEYETFYDRHLSSLTDHRGWRHDTLLSLELIGMSSFGVLKSLNFIHRNSHLIERGDPEQRFKNVYFHFGLVSDSIDSLARNIAITMDYLGIVKIDSQPKDREALKRLFETWMRKKYEKNIAELIATGKQVVFHPHSIDFLSYSISDKLRAEFRGFVTSLKEYRNFYTHNPGVDIIQLGMGDLYVVKRERRDEARSWSNLRTMIEKSHEMFVDPKEQINQDLITLLKYLRQLWTEFGLKMDEVQQHDNYGIISSGFPRKVE